MKDKKLVCDEKGHNSQYCDVRDLITPKCHMERHRAFYGLSEYSSPPCKGDTGINQQVNDCNKQGNKW